jgi:hypothetical protein
MDDISPLRQADAGVASSTAFLYKPATAIRTSSEDFQGTPLPPEIPKAANPPDGAIIDYYLAAAQDQVTLEIVDGRNQVVRRYSTMDKVPAPSRRSRAVADIWIVAPPRLTGRAGMNRFVWDLRYAAPGTAGPQVLPGTYQVRLSVAGRTFEQPLTVALDPRSSTLPADLESQLDLGLKAVRALEQAAEAMAQIGEARTKLNSLKLNASGNPAALTLLPEIAASDREMEQILTALSNANSELTAVLEVAKSADRRPPAQAWTLLAEAEQELAGQQAKWNAARGKLPHAP